MISFEDLRPWQKVVLICFFSVALAIVLICLGTVWVSDPKLTSRLLLILVAFSAAASGMIYLSKTTIEEIKAERLPDAESRTDSVIIGTILVLVVLTGGLIEMAGLTSFSRGGFTACCTGLLGSLASLVSGVLVGFLFGVPRSVAAPAASQIPPIARRPPPPGVRARAPTADQAQPAPGDQAQAPAAVRRSLHPTIKPGLQQLVRRSLHPAIKPRLQQLVRRSLRPAIKPRLQLPLRHSLHPAIKPRLQLPLRHSLRPAIKLRLQLLLRHNLHRAIKLRLQLLIRYRLRLRINIKFLVGRGACQRRAALPTRQIPI